MEIALRLKRLAARKMATEHNPDIGHKGVPCLQLNLVLTHRADHLKEMVRPIVINPARVNADLGGCRCVPGGD